ncbi:MAG: hypothetical protein K1X50_14675 [Candidatus Promineofilum sp.]|nr:hypothetical protein [Promineifilum sp.]
MGWETRGNGTYYYRKARDGGRVVSEYIGAGMLAEAYAELDAEARAAAASSRAAWAATVAVTQATADYRAESDTLGQFIAECCHVAEGATARGGELYAAYTTWAEQNGLRPLSNKRLGSALRERGYASDRDGRGNYWIGLGLLAAAPTP